MKRTLLLSLFVSQVAFANALFDYTLKKAQEEEVRKAIELEDRLIKVLKYRIEVEHNTTMPSKTLLKTKYGLDLGDSITLSSDDNISNIIIRNNQIINNPALKSIYDRLQKDRPEFINRTQNNEINLSLKTPLSLQGVLTRTKLIKTCDNNKTTEKDGTTAVMLCGGVAYDVMAIDGEWRALNFTSVQELKSGAGSSSVIAKYSIKELVDSCKTLKVNQTIRMDFDYYNIFGENLRNMEFAKVTETNSTDINRTYCVGIKFGKSYFLASDLRNLPINTRGEYNTSEAWLSDIKYIYDNNYTCPSFECGTSKEKYARVLVSDKNTSWVIAADTIDELSMALSNTYSSGFRTVDGNITRNLLGKVGRSRSGLVYTMIRTLDSSTGNYVYYWESKDANSSNAQYRFIARNVVDLPIAYPRAVSDKDNGVATIGGIIRNGVHNNNDADNISTKFEVISDGFILDDARWSLVLPNLVALAELTGSNFSSFLLQKDNFRIMLDFNNNLIKDGNDRYMVLKGAGSAEPDIYYWHSTENPIDIFLTRDRKHIPTEFSSLNPEQKKRVRFFTITNDCNASDCHGNVNTTQITRCSGSSCSTSTYANYYAGDLTATNNINLYHYVVPETLGFTSPPTLKHKNNLTDLVIMTHTQAYNFKDLNISDANGSVKATYDNPNATYPHAFLFLNKAANAYQMAIRKTATDNTSYPNNTCIDFYNSSTTGSFSGTCGRRDDGVYFAIGNMGITKKQGLLWPEAINFPTGITYQTAEFAGDSNTSPLKVGFVYQFTNCWYGQNKGCGTSVTPAHGVAPMGQKVLISNPVNSFNNFCFQKRFEGQASQLPNVSRVWWQRGTDANCTSLLTLDDQNAVYISYSARNNFQDFSKISLGSRIRDNNISLLSPSFESPRAELYSSRPLLFTLRYDDISKNTANPHFFYRWVDDVCGVASTSGGSSYVVNALTNLCRFDKPEDANDSNHPVYTARLGNKSGIFDAALISFGFSYFQNSQFFKGINYRGYFHQPQNLRHNLSTPAQPSERPVSSGSVLYRAYDANFWFLNSSSSSNIASLNGCYLDTLTSTGLGAYATKNNFVDFGHYNPNPANFRRYCYTTRFGGPDLPENWRRVNVLILNINTTDTSICASPGFCYNNSWPTTQPW